jgi:hypothetical protein
MRHICLFSPEPATKSQRTLNTTNTPEDGVFGWFKYVQDFPGENSLDLMALLN